MKNEFYKKGWVFGITLLFIGVATTTPVLGSNLAKNNFIMDNSADTIAENSHPMYYDITIWRLRLGGYEEEVKRVSYEEAMQIKAEYETIENNGGNLLNQAKQKNTVLRDHGVLSADDTLELYEEKFVECMKTQDKTLLQKLIRYVLSKYLLPSGFAAVAWSGFLIGYLHGPMSGMTVGIPLPATGLVYHEATGHGPAAGVATFDLLFPFPLVWNFVEPNPKTEIDVMMVGAMGLVSYLPFIKSWNDDGRFEVAVFTIYGHMDPGIL